MNHSYKRAESRLVHKLCAILLSSFMLSCPLCLKAQIAGTTSLAVLDLSLYARSGGLGFDYLTVWGDDPTVGLQNPSLLNPEMDKSAVLSFVPMFAGSNAGAIGYVHQTKRLGTLSAGFNFMNYGRMEGYSEEELYEGSFGAGDYMLSIGWGTMVDSCYSVGVSFKPILSQYETYTAVAVAFDVAGSYISPSKSFAATLLMRNVGAQIITFDKQTERLPFELNAALSYKLRRAPFRLFFMATELQRWNLRYEDPLAPTEHTDPFTGEVTRQSAFVGMIDNLFRHVQAGVELNLGTALYARVGYSYRQSAEMQGYDALNLSGFSFGIGFRTHRFEFAYARHNYHVSQAPNYLTLIYRF